MEAVECLSVCKRPCTIAVSGPGRWTYIYGDLSAETSVETILDGLRRYAATSDGLVPWRERPEAFRKGVAMGVNYGIDKLRFPAPVPVGSNLRLGVKLLSVTDIAGGVQVTCEYTFEVEGASKPSCVAEVLFRMYL